MNTMKSYLNKILDSYTEARKTYEDELRTIERIQKQTEKALRSGNLTPTGMEHRRKSAAEAIQEAQDTLHAAVKEAEDSFAAVRAEVDNIFGAAYRISPDKLDVSTVEILKSDMLSVSELKELAASYTDNYTMLRYIGKYARERAQKRSDETEDLMPLAYQIDRIPTHRHLEGVDAMIHLCSSALRDDSVLANGVASRLDEIAGEIIDQYGGISA